MPFQRKGHFNDSDFIDATFDAEQEELSAPKSASAFGGLNMSQSSSIELKVVRPEKFEDVLVVANHLIAGRTVVIDFEITNRDTVKRIKDFLGGVAYSINGQLQKVANNTYIATPNNVDVSEDKTRHGVDSGIGMSSSVRIDDIDSID